MEAQSGKIYAAISAIMGEIDAIGKNRKNAQQNYSYRGIDDVYNALNASMAKHGVFTVPEVLEMKREERPTKSGGVLVWSILTVRYTFYASDGSSFQTVVIGEGMDSGDKASNKAMSVAQKYAFFQIFAIPTEEPKDPEVDSHAPLPKQPEAHKVEPDAVLMPGDFVTPFGTKAGRKIKDLTDGEIIKGLQWCELPKQKGRYADWVRNATLYLEKADMVLDK